MRSHPPLLDGGPRTRRSCRLARQAPVTSPGQYRPVGQTRHCCACGNRIELFPRADHRLVALHPSELAAAVVPEDCRWHLSAGIAHPGGDGSPWCRIPHRLVCPCHEVPPQPRSHLDAVRLRLALRTRGLRDTGTFASTARRAEQSLTTPARPVARVLLNLYLASTPAKNIRCVAQRPPRPPCSQHVLDVSSPADIWRRLPAGLQRGQGQPPPPMTVDDLSRLGRVEQLRRRAQHCPNHAAVAPDLDQSEWQVFAPLPYAAHIHTHLPRP